MIFDQKHRQQNPNVTENRKTFNTKKKKLCCYLEKQRVKGLLHCNISKWKSFTSMSREWLLNFKSLWPWLVLGVGKCYSCPSVSLANEWTSLPVIHPSPFSTVLQFFKRTPVSLSFIRIYFISYRVGFLLWKTLQILELLTHPRICHAFPSIPPGTKSHWGLLSKRQNKQTYKNTTTTHNNNKKLNKKPK